MPQSWHDYHAIGRDTEECDRDFYRAIVADKKPYFMRYIYPALMRQYNEYIKNSNKKSLREFGATVEELEQIPEGDRSENVQGFLGYFYKLLPISTGNCVMNRICRRFEDEFDGYLVKHRPEEKFDYSIMKRGEFYTRNQVMSLNDVYRTYNHRVQDFVVFSMYERVDEDEAAIRFEELRDRFIQQAQLICSNRFVLCDILLDLCYKKNSTKKFVWDICGDEIVENLLARNDMTITVPVSDPVGDIEYLGERMSLQKIKLECFDEYNPE